MSNYQFWRAPCPLCSREFPNRDMVKIYMGESHHSCPTPRKLCNVCDNCFPKLLDFLEVSEPEEPERKPYVPPRWCDKCRNRVGKTAVFCPYCGDKLEPQKPTVKEVLLW